MERFPVRCRLEGEGSGDPKNRGRRKSKPRYVPANARRRVTSCDGGHHTDKVGLGFAPEYDDQVRELGSSTGRLVDNLREFDPYTGIPRMSAIEVSIRRVPPPVRESVARSA